MLTRFVDGMASLLAAIAALGVTLPPAWFTHVAVQGGLAPAWAYGFVVVLAIIGIILAVAFARKAAAGIAPAADRRR